MCIMHHKAFSLSEVLMSLIILGLITAIISPVIRRNFQDVQFRTAYKNNFAILKDVVNKIKYDNGGTLVNAFGSSYESMANTFANYLNVATICPTASCIGGPCWVELNKFYYLDNTAISSIGTNPSGLVLNNGTNIILVNLGSNCANASDLTNHGFYRCGWMFIDVNGFNPPNVVGKDIFSLHITPEYGLIPYGSHGDLWAESECTTHGWGCSSEYLYK